MTPDEARRRFGASPVARFATVRPDGAPHIVPVTFVLAGDTVWWAVDHKPKTGPNLQRLENLKFEPRASLLADHYDDDWSALWWVRADGTAGVASGAEVTAALEALAAKYPAYRKQPPPGPVVSIEVTRWHGWSAAAAVVF